MGWLSSATLISVETGRKEPLVAPGFDTLVSRAYGKACVHLLRPEG
jgi:hypothetical protein